MMWKAIGYSAAGTAHTAADKGCEDAIRFRSVYGNDGEALVCCASDGAGSTQYGGWAAEFSTSRMVDRISQSVNTPAGVTEAAVYAMVEEIYEELHAEAEYRQADLSEFSCTLLGCCIMDSRSVFFQVGDGAIVRNDGLDFYTAVWWPQNGEYLNTTSFLADDPTFKDLRIAVIHEPVAEVALFTDGLQLLALNMEAGTVHQPFFEDLFRVVRIAENEEEVGILQQKLAEFLESSQVNSRTDDDKTLFLASRLVS